jgi:hypothetical protein
VTFMACESVIGPIFSLPMYSISNLKPVGTQRVSVPNRDCSYMLEDTKK